MTINWYTAVNKILPNFEKGKKSCMAKLILMGKGNENPTASLSMWVNLTENKETSF